MLRNGFVDNNADWVLGIAHSWVNYCAGSLPHAFVGDLWAGGFSACSAQFLTQQCNHAVPIGLRIVSAATHSMLKPSFL